MSSQGRSMRSSKTGSEASKQLLVQASQLIKQVKGTAEKRSDQGAGAGHNQRTASSSSDFFAKLKTTAHPPDMSTAAKKLLHLCVPGAPPSFGSMLLPRPGSSHVKTLSSTSASGLESVPGLNGKGGGKCPAKALKDSLIEKERGIQDIETKLHAKAKATRRQLERGTERQPSEDQDKYKQSKSKTNKRGHNTILAPQIPHSVRGDHPRRISSKCEPASSACLLEAPRQYGETENQEESTKTGKESTEGTKVQQLKGKLKMLMLGPARCGKLPSKKSSASNYNTLNYSPNNKSSRHQDSMKMQLGNSKKSAVLEGSPQPEQSREVRVVPAAVNRPPLVQQLDRLKRRLTKVLTKVPLCIGTLKSELQQLSLPIAK
jgi:hypothetical protein